MSRVLLFLAGVIIMALLALCIIWLAGQLALGIGLLLVGLSDIFFKLLWFCLLSGLLGGVAYFITSAWRPVRSAVIATSTHSAADQHSTEQHLTAAKTDTDNQ